MPLTLGMLTGGDSGGTTPPVDPPTEPDQKPTLIGSPVFGSSTTWSHTVAAGTRCLIVRAMVGNASFSSGLATCTWNGQNMTRAVYIAGTANSNFTAVAIFYLMNPTPGTGNVVIDGFNSDYYSSENWANVSAIGSNNKLGGSSALSSFSFTFSKTKTLNVLLSVASLQDGSGWTPGASNIEEYDSSYLWGRGYMGRAETTNIIAATGAGGSNTFAAAALELIAGPP